MGILLKGTLSLIIFWVNNVNDQYLYSLFSTKGKQRWNIQMWEVSPALTQAMRNCVRGTEMSTRGHLQQVNNLHHHLQGVQKELVLLRHLLLQGDICGINHQTGQVWTVVFPNIKKSEIYYITLYTCCSLIFLVATISVELKGAICLMDQLFYAVCTINKILNY